MEDKVKQLRQALVEADKDCIEALEAIDHRRNQIKKEKADLDAKFEDAKKNDMNNKVLLKEQEKRLEETKKLIIYLKKENKKARLQYDKLLEKSAIVRSDAQRHIAYNEDVRNNFEGLDHETAKVSDKNEDLMERLEFERKENKRLVKLVRNMQDKYMTKAENRLTLQKGMAKILDMIQSECKDSQIVEDAVVVALECDTEAKSEMAALGAMDEEELGYVSTDVSNSESHSDCQ
jgi:chromosome segregation ATPase